MVASGISVVAIVITVVLFWASGSIGDNSEGGAEHPPPAGSPAALDGLHELCSEASIQRGDVSDGLRAATSTALCQTESGEMIAIGSYRSYFDMRNDLRRFPDQPYATTSTRKALWVVVALTTQKPSVLTSVRGRFVA